MFFLPPALISGRVRIQNIISYLICYITCATLALAVWTIYIAILFFFSRFPPVVKPTYSSTYIILLLYVYLLRSRSFHLFQPSPTNLIRAQSRRTRYRRCRYRTLWLRTVSIFSSTYPRPHSSEPATLLGRGFVLVVSSRSGRVI